MLKGMIAINDPNGVYNPYIPVGIYVRIKPEEICDKFKLSLCETCISKMNKLPLIIISYENHKVIKSNQNEITEQILFTRVDELYTLSWNGFQIMPILRKATVPYYDYVFQLLRS